MANAQVKELKFLINNVDPKSFRRVVSTLERETPEFTERLQKKYHENEEEPYVLLQTVWQRLQMIGQESYNKGKKRVISPKSRDGQYFCINTGLQNGDLYEIYLFMSVSTPIRTIAWFTVEDKKYTDMFDLMPARCAAQRRKNGLNFYLQHDIKEPVRIIIPSTKDRQKIETLCKGLCPDDLNVFEYFKSRARESFNKARHSVNAFICVDDGQTFDWMIPVSLHLRNSDSIDCFACVHLNPTGRCYMTKVFAPDEGYCFANVSESKVSRQEPILRNMLIPVN